MSEDNTDAEVLAIARAWYALEALPRTAQLRATGYLQDRVHSMLIADAHAEREWLLSHVELGHKEREALALAQKEPKP